VFVVSDLAFLLIPNGEVGVKERVKFLSQFMQVRQVLHFAVGRTKDGTQNVKANIRFGHGRSP
jgi:hypothetical protein